MGLIHYTRFFIIACFIHLFLLISVWQFNPSISPHQSLQKFHLSFQMAQQMTEEQLSDPSPSSSDSSEQLREKQQLRSSENATQSISDTPPSGSQGNPLEHAQFSDWHAPFYPRLSLRQGHEGTSILLLKVKPNGQVVKTEILQSSGYRSLDLSAIKATKKWRFSLPKNSNMAFFWIKVPVEFRID